MSPIVPFVEITTPFTMISNLVGLLSFVFNLKMETHFNNPYIDYTIGNMSYVPPHLRNKQPTNDTQEQLTNTFKNERRPPRRVYDKPPVESVNTRIIEKTEENFPTLVSVNPTLRTQPGGRKFNELASDWKVEDDIRKEQEQLGKETNKNNVFIL